MDILQFLIKIFKGIVNYTIFCFLSGLIVGITSTIFVLDAAYQKEGTHLNKVIQNVVCEF